MKPEPWHSYEAEVRVKNKATLRPDADLNDGDIIQVSYGWTMGEDEQFPGQVAFLRDRGYWIPEEDLILLKDVTLTRKYNI